MTEDIQFFSNPICRNTLNHWMGWFFFILANTFSIYIIFVNPFKINYNNNSDNYVIKLILYLTSLFITSVISRCICYTQKDDSNIIRYDKMQY